MSATNEISVDCGGCGESQPFVVWSSVNVTLYEHQKEELLSGKLNRFKCKKCGWSGEVAVSLLYHDMENQIMIWLFPKSEVPATAALPVDPTMGDYRYRLVHTTNQLREKIYIFDAGLDDRLIEFFKLRLAARSVETGQASEGEWYFAKQFVNEDKNGTVQFVHISNREMKGLIIPRQSLIEAGELLAKVLPPASSEKWKWLKVDRDYAQQLEKV